MANAKLGFRILPSPPRLPAALIDQFRGIASPNIADSMGRFNFMDPGIVSRSGVPVCGPALTVNCRPADNLMVHKSLDVAEPGDVIVVDAGGSTMNAVLGDLVSSKARHRGVAGFVVDGLIRDLPAIRAFGDFPVYARGVTPIGPLHRGPGEINHAICCGGIVVHPGDIIMGDLNGVVVIPLAIADPLLESLREKAESEAEYTAAVARGDFSNEWVDRFLTKSGLPPSRAGDLTARG